MCSLSNDVKKEENQEVVTFEKLEQENCFGPFCCVFLVHDLKD